MRSELHSPRRWVPGSLVLALGLLGLAVPAMPVLAGELPASASAQITSLAALEASGDQMSFGAVETVAGGGEVALNPAGSLSGPSGFGFSGLAAAPVVTVTAPPQTALSVTLASGPLHGPGAAIALREVTHDGGGELVTDAAGRLVLRLGAVVVVGANQAPGAYSGLTQVIVNY